MPGRDDAANAASWIGDVSLVARNQMEMDMKHRLPRRHANIDPEIESVRRAFPKQPLARFIRKRQEIAALVCRGFKPAGDVPARNEQHMARRHRGFVEQSEGKRILKYGCARMTKWAVLTHTDHTPLRVLAEFSRDIHSRYFCARLGRLAAS